MPVAAAPGYLRVSNNWLHQIFLLENLLNKQLGCEVPLHSGRAHLGKAG